MATIRADAVSGTISTSGGISSTDTVFDSDSLADLPAVGSGDIARVTFATFDGVHVSAFEIVHVTDHTSGSTSATISRGQEGTSAQSWANGTDWFHALNVQDIQDIVTDLSNHTGDTTNPHSVTVTQVGAVENLGSTPSVQADTRANQPAAGTVGRLYHVTDEDVLERDNGTSWLQILDLAHRNDAANPHSVTATQAGAVDNIGNVPSFEANTRANQPAAGTAGRLYWVTDEDVIERDDGAAWQQALDLTHRNDTTNPHGVTTSQIDAANNPHANAEHSVNFSPQSDVHVIVFHGTDSTVARPSGYSYVEWRGDAEPDNAQDNDIWIPDTIDNQHHHNAKYQLLHMEDVTHPTYGAAGDGVADDSPAFQLVFDLLDSQDTLTVFVPPGDYRIESQVAKSLLTNKRVHVKGAGPQLTRVIVPTSVNTAGFLSLDHDDNDHWFICEDLAVIVDGEGGGTAIANINNDPQGGRHNRQVYIRNVEVRPLNVSTDYFNTCIDVSKCWRPMFETVITSGPFGSTVNDDKSDTSPLYNSDFGILIDDCFSPVLNDCYVWGADRGIVSRNNTTAQPQAINLQGTRIVHTREGFVWQRDGMEPAVRIDNCHFNCRDRNIDIDGARQVWITNCNPYNSDNNEQSTDPVDIDLLNTREVTIFGTIFHDVNGHTGRRCIVVDGSGSNDFTLITHNTFQGVAATAIDVLAGATRTHVVGNQYNDTNVTTRVADAADAVTILDVDSDYRWKMESQDDQGQSDPRLLLDRFRSSPANNDDLGAIDLRGNNDGGNLTEFVRHAHQAQTVTAGAEDGKYILWIVEAGGFQRAVEVQPPPTNNDTGLILRVDKGGTHSNDKVSIGATDSGGTGFRVLRVPN